MNRKGQVPTILLLVMALVLVISALSIFVSFGGNFDSRSSEISNILANADFYQRYLISESEIAIKEVASEKLYLNEEDLKMRFREIMKKKDFGIFELRHYFDKMEKGEFSFKKEGDKYRFEINNVSVYSESGANRYERNFGFEIEVDADGKVNFNEHLPKDL